LWQERCGFFVVIGRMWQALCVWGQTYPVWGYASAKKESKIMSIQKQVHSYFRTVDGEGREIARCPFCQEPTIGIYVDGNIEIREKCNHSMGFVVGADGMPLVVFESDTDKREVP
jgi:hypothetical protein